MADLSQHTNYTGAYSGLLDNLWVTLAIAGACYVGYEIEVHVPRRHGRQGTHKSVPVRVYVAGRSAWGRWRSRRRKDGDGERGVLDDGERIRSKQDELRAAREQLGSRESWEFGYIFQPKAWRLNPAPPVPRWPLAWIGAALRVRERDMPETCGLDVTLHARFLRGAFFYTLLQACVVLPILMPVHIFYAPDTVTKTSMTRAGISSLVESSGTHWLWIHAVLIWWITITWTCTILWITWGALAYRKRDIKRLQDSVQKTRERRQNRAAVLAANPEQGDEMVGEAMDDEEESEGAKRFRTLLVENIPPDMRNEEVLRDYFDHYLQRHRLRNGEITHHATWVKQQVEEKQGQIMRRVHFKPGDMFRKQPVPAEKLEAPGMTRGDTNETFDMIDHDSADGMASSEVEEIVLVRKLGGVASLRARRNAVLRHLEVAHVKLAQRVLKVVAKHQKKHGFPTNTYTPIQPVHDVDAGLDALNAPRDEHLPLGLSKDERLSRLVAALGKFVGDAPEQLGEGEETVWDILHALPRALLDPYQALTHLKVTSFFRNQNAPLIDYLTTKLNYLTHRLDQARDKPLSSYGASSTAFVTFKDARTARLALKLLASHPTRTLACRASAAPDWTNLLWNRLCMSIYRSEFVRKWVIQVGVWVFTLIWIFPVSVLCALSSFTNIAGFIAPLKAFLAEHPKIASAISSLAPVILVAGLTIAICPILLVIANKAETVNTRLAVHNSVLERFWKFLMVNGVVFFAIGQSAIEAYLTAFQNNDFDPLPIVASAFPTAAPYFASYILLQVAIQPCFEIFRFGLPTIVYVFGTRKSVIPRQRLGRTEYPTFSHFSQVPQQLLQGAIMHLFMLLNPLVIPFSLVYYGTCYVVWKRQFTYVYGRLYENNGRRTSVRVVRYSLDALALAQFVLFAFFILNKAKGHAIATGILFFLTLGEKLIISRALKRRFDDLDVAEADIICPPTADDSGSELLEIISPSSDVPHPSKQEGLAVPPSGISVTPMGVFTAARSYVTAWAEKWIFAVSHRTAPGYRRPIPFDHIFFSWLDRLIVFEPEPSAKATIVKSETDDELKHEPDHAIHHPIAQKLVQLHHPLRPWEDIPPYPRSRGYNDQPAYTDDYDDFLWLPRDPLSTLDLDDTVEMRLSLTTSAGGSGRMGDWPPDGDDEELEGLDLTEGDVTLDGGDFGPSTSGHISGFDDAPPISPGGRSVDRLIEPLDLPHEMGSEAPRSTSDLVRRHTKRAGERWNSLLRRPRAGTTATDHSGLISMRTLSIVSRTSHEDMAVTASPAPATLSLAIPPQTAPAEPAAVTDPSLPLRRPSGLSSRPGTASSLPPNAFRVPPRRPTTGDSTKSDGSITLAAVRQSSPTRPRPIRMASSGGSSHIARIVDDARITDSVEELGDAGLSSTTSLPAQPGESSAASTSGPVPTAPVVSAGSGRPSSAHGSPSIRLLGRSPSGRRPSRLLSPAQTPARGVSEAPATGFTIPDRRASMISTSSYGGAAGNHGQGLGRTPSSVYTSTPGRALSRSRTTRRERAESVSVAQQALMAEVMEEERIAASSSTHKEEADVEREAEEVMKEQAKLRRVSKAVARGLSIARSGSKRTMSVSRSGGQDVADGQVGGQVRSDLIGRSSSARRVDPATATTPGSAPMGAPATADGTVQVKGGEEGESSGSLTASRTDEMGRMGAPPTPTLAPAVVVHGEDAVAVGAAPAPEGGEGRPGDVFDSKGEQKGGGA